MNALFFSSAPTLCVLLFTSHYCLSQGGAVKRNHNVKGEGDCAIPRCTCVSKKSEVRVNCCGVTSSDGEKERNWVFPTNTSNLILEKSDVMAVPWESLTRLHRLRILQLHRCTIKDSEQLQPLRRANFSTNITNLNIGWNSLQKVDVKLLSLFPSVEHLYLAFNNITVIKKGCFRLAPRLAYLDLSSNPIGPLLASPDALSGLQHLRELRMENCSIRAFHRQAFKDLKNLRYLYVAHNELTVVPVSTLLSSPHLIFLNLAFNKITTVDNNFSRLNRLHYLYLHNNGLKAIYPGALDGFDSLQQIVLNDNQLRTLPVGLQPSLQQMPRLQAISLVNVTWSCDCHLLWLVRLEQMAAVTSSLAAPSLSRCYWPRHLQGKSLRDLSLHSLRCPKLPGCQEGELVSVQCQWCPPFQKPVAGGSHCVCMEGYEFEPSAVPVCQPCPDGFFKAEVTNGACAQCPANSTTLTTGANVCHCLPGYTLSATFLCQPCAVNTFKSKLGNHACHRCPLNSRGPSGSDSLRHCQCLQPQHYLNADVRQCVSNRDDVNFHPSLPTVSGQLSVGGHENKQTKIPYKGAGMETSNNRPVLQSGVVVAIGTGTAVVLTMTVGIILSGMILKRLGCQKTNTFFSDPLNSTGHVPEVTIENNLVSYASPDPKPYIRRLRIGRLLGRGAFGQVHGGLLFTSQNNVKNTVPVAVKRLKDKSSEEEGRALQEELEQMILVGHHPNIIQLIGSCLHKGNLHIIMELAEGGDLLTYLRQGKVRHEQYVSVGPDGSLREQQTPGVTDHQDLMLFAWHIAKGMTYLEGVKCIHRDLAARNCLLTAGPVAKLSDFGLSRDVYESGYYFRRHKGRVPFKWLSPEALLWGQYSTKSDVWSYGILLWEVATFGGTPYSGVPPDRIAEMHRGRHRLPQPPACPETLYRVMRSCWHEDPRKRPRFHTLCDVMETFVQAATEHSYLDLQGHTRPVLPDLSPETEHPPLPGHPSPYSNDVTVLPSNPQGFPSSRCTSPYDKSSPYSNTPPRRLHYCSLHENSQPLPYDHLPVKTSPLSVLHRLGWGLDQEDSGGDHSELSGEEGIELQPMLCSRWEEEEEGGGRGGDSSGSSAASSCLVWGKRKEEELRENCWTSGYSSSPSWSTSRVDTEDGKASGVS